MSLDSALRKLRRIRDNVLPDTMDNFGREKAPNAAERIFTSPEEARAVLDRLCPKESLDAIRHLTEHFEVGHTQRARTVVGDAESGTRHPHDFVIEKDEMGTSLYFVDPEHYVGERNMRRPSISNLMALRIPKEDTSLPGVVITRFRTASLAASDRTELKMDNQLVHARELFHTQGVPTFLAATLNEIVFRTMITEERGIVQSRYVGTTFALEMFLDGNKSAYALEGKVTAQNAVLESFVRLLQEGAFEDFAEKKSQQPEGTLPGPRKVA